MSSLTLLKSLTVGYLAGLPLVMTVQPKVCTNPVDGSSQTVYVVGVEYAGSLTDLQKTTLAIAQGNAEFRARLAHVEEETRKLISVDAQLIDEAADITEEYYPPEEPVPQIATPPQAPAPAAATNQPAPALTPAAAPAAAQTAAPAPAAAPVPSPAHDRAKRGRKPRQTITAPEAPAAAPAPATQPQDPPPPPIAAPQNPPEAVPTIDLF